MSRKILLGGRTSGEPIFSVVQEHNPPNFRLGRSLAIQRCVRFLQNRFLQRFLPNINCSNCTAKIRSEVQALSTHPRKVMLKWQEGSL